MDRKILLALFALALLVPAASAFDESAFTRCLAGTASHAAVTGLQVSMKSLCAVVKWNSVSDADYNHVVVRISSNSSSISSGDYNTSGTEFVACTLGNGEWIEATVFRIDGNADGYCLNTVPDANMNLRTGSPIQGGQYLVYSIFAGIGGVIILVILAALLVFLIAKFKLRLF